MDLAVGESAGTSSPWPSGGDNDEAKKFEEVSFIDGVHQVLQAEKVKAVLDEVHFEKGLGLDVGEEDLDTGCSAKGFGQLGQEVGVQHSKDKLVKVSLKKVVGSLAVDEVSVEGCAGTKGGEAKVGEVLSEAAASQRGAGELVLDSGEDKCAFFVGLAAEGALRRRLPRCCSGGIGVASIEGSSSGSCASVARWMALLRQRQQQVWLGTVCVGEPF